MIHSKDGRWRGIQSILPSRRPKGEGLNKNRPGDQDRRLKRDFKHRDVIGKASTKKPISVRERQWKHLHEKLATKPTRSHISERPREGGRERRGEGEGEGEHLRHLLGVWNVRVCTSWQQLTILEEGGAQ